MQLKLFAISTLLVGALAAPAPAPAQDLVPAQIFERQGQINGPGGPVNITVLNGLLANLGKLGEAIKTATGLTSGTGNNPLGLAGNLPGFLSNLGVIRDLTNGILYDYPKLNGTLTPGESDQICRLLRVINLEKNNLNTGVGNAIGKPGLLNVVGKVVNDAIKPVLGPVLSLVTGLVDGLRGALTNGAVTCNLAVNPGLGAGAGVGAGV